VLINLYFHFCICVAENRQLPEVIYTHVLSHLPLSAYNCYKRAAEVMGYVYDDFSATILAEAKKIQTTTETDMLENPELNLRNYRKPFFTRGVHFRRQPIEQMKSFWKIHDV